MTTYTISTGRASVGIALAHFTILFDAPGSDKSDAMELIEAVGSLHFLLDTIGMYDAQKAAFENQEEVERLIGALEWAAGYLRQGIERQTT